MLTPTRTSEPYTLQVLGETGWIPLSHYGESCLEDAVRHCERAVWTEKSRCRIIENANSNIVLEKFYNAQYDPEHYQDEYWWEDEDLDEVNWQTEGF